jgi:hypothetical protein
VTSPALGIEAAPIEARVAVKLKQNCNVLKFKAYLTVKTCPADKLTPFN